MNNHRSCRWTLCAALPLLVCTSLLVSLPSMASESALLAASAPAQAGRIVVKFTDEARVRLRGEGLVSLGGSDTRALDEVISRFSQPLIERLFTRNETEIDRYRAAAAERSGRTIADLNGYFEFVVEPGQASQLVESLKGLAIVQTAYLAPVPAPPPGDIPPTTPDYEPHQGYLDPAPGGVDAREAWTRPGGRGAGVKIIDVEYDWRDTHEDLDQALGGKECYTPKGAYIEHGTAVLGELGGGDNGYGVTGIVPEAELGMVTQDPVDMSNSVARAIDCAASLLGPGDIILVEAQTGGPHGDYVPVEWRQAEYDSIAAATASGIIVVEAAGNGNEDLDGPDFEGKFDRSVRDSGAIIVGAGAPPTSGQPDRSRLSFSTYGSRVDVQGWGELVYTSGYGDLFDGGGDPNQYYRATFNGTSSASPVVTGAAAALQGVQIARGGAPLSPVEVRQILTDTGTAQQDGPYSGHIGPRPDLARALDELAILYVSRVDIDDQAPLGNDDGVLDPGETAVLRLTVDNSGTESANNLSGVLRAKQPNLFVLTDHHALWPDLPAGTSAESLSPHHRITVQPDAACGDIARIDVDLTSDLYSDFGLIELPLGQHVATYPSTDTPITIPQLDANGIASTLEVTDDFALTDLQVTVNISHGDIGELVVRLRSPTGTLVTLHNHSQVGTVDLVTTFDRDRNPDGPGTMDDFDGESSLGSWVLQVGDTLGTSVPAGTLNSWTLELKAGEVLSCAPLSCADPVPPVMGNSLRLQAANPDDLELSWTAHSGIAEYRIWRSPSPRLSDAVLVGQTPATSLIEPGALTESVTVVFYQLRGVNSCEWEGP